MNLTDDLRKTAKLILLDWDITQFEALQIAVKVQRNEIELRQLIPEIKLAAQQQQRVVMRERPPSPCGPNGCKPRLIQKPVQEGEAYSTEGCVE